MYTETLEMLKKEFSNRRINQNDIPLVSNHFSKINTINILKSIMNDHSLCEKIANRSYTHALGFDKIVLIDLSKDVSSDLPKAQLRLHIWNPENDAVPMVESLHEHSFDFVSMILSGYLENQCFTMNKELDDDHLWVLSDLKDWIEKSSPEKVKMLDQSIEILEAKRLSLLGSEQFDSMYTDLDLLSAVRFITTQTPFKSIESVLFYIPSLQGHYVSDRIAGEKKAYKHVLDKYVLLKPYNCPITYAGDAYFHPYELPHRLFYDNKQLNATILITTPVPENSKGGSLQRPTYVQKEEQNYDKKPISIDELKNKLCHITELLINKED